jgi:hypothetical protein
MSRRVIQLEDRTILFSPDDSAPRAGRLQALVKLRVIDELSDGPPNSRLTLEVSEPGLIPRVAGDGLAGLVGIPQQVFPNLKMQDYFVHLTVKAVGYVPRDMEVQVAIDPQFPTTFMPPPLINLALHREPIVITGRTMMLAKDNTITPLAGATVSVTKIWRTPPPFNADKDALADPSHLVSLRPPLYADRAAVTGHLQPRDLTPIAGDDKLLLEDILAGTNPIRLSNRQNLAPGDILLIDAGQPDIAEFLAISAITGASTADQPAQITLDYATVHAHRRNAVIQKVNPQPLGAVQQFTVEALTGDTCVFLDDVAGLAAANEVQITGGASPDEYHTVKNFSVTGDADGYYWLPPLSRVAQLELHAEKIVGMDTFSLEKIEFRPDYNLRENRLDLTLTPTA